MLLTEFVRAGTNAWLMVSAVGCFFFYTVKATDRLLLWWCPVFIY